MTSRGEGGTAMVGTIVGFLIFMVLLLFATQVIVRLYAESTLTSVATRAADTVASAAEPVSAEGPAEQDALARLGSFGSRHTTFSWQEVDGQQVVLEVDAHSPELIPGLSGWSHIQRTVTVRTERFR